MLYVDPSRRFFLKHFDRNEDYTPAVDHQAPDLDRLPFDMRRQLLRESEVRDVDAWESRVEWDRGNWLETVSDRLLRHKLGVAFDVDETAARATKLANLSVKLKDYAAIENMAVQLDLELPEGNSESTEASIALRCHEPKTWRRIIDKKNTRMAENELRKIGFIQKGDQLYCSDLAVNWYQGKMRTQEAYLKSRTVSDGTTQLELWDVVQKSISNKSNRRTELMTRMRGLEDYSKEVGHVGTFITLTAPSAFHSRLFNGGSNPLFNEGDVRSAQGWLCRMWARARAKLQKLKVEIYGMRVAEPHHDGTPHWHMVLFCAPDHRESLCDVLRSKWLSEHGGESGAHEHRATFKAIESAKGSATGYLSKYIAKNIDGFDVGKDYEQDGAEASDTVTRVTAWASIHGIRQFQQIGKRSAGVTLYRTCRRRRRATDTPRIERLRLAADVHDYCGFIKVSERWQFSLWKESGVSVDRATGEIVVEKNAFGEVRPPKIVGVETLTERMRTRLKTWRIERKFGPNRAAGKGVGLNAGSGFEASGPVRAFSESALGPVSITVAAGPGLSDPHGWTNPNETSMYGPN